MSKPIGPIESGITHQNGGFLSRMSGTTRLGIFGFLSLAILAGTETYRSYETGREINNNRTANKKLEDDLNASNEARDALSLELSRSNAVIARLETEMAELRKSDAGQGTEIAALKGVDKDHETNIEGLKKTATDYQVAIKGLSDKTEANGKELSNVDQALAKLTKEVSKLEGRVTLDQVSDVYRKTIPSVVNLSVKYETEVDDGMGGKTKEVRSQNGAGAVVAHIEGGKKGGYIATNWHVLNYENLKEDDLKNLEVSVLLHDGTRVKAKPYFYKDTQGHLKPARSTEHDLILLVVLDDITNTMPIAMASGEPQRGEPILVIGGPFNLEHSASMGVVSALRDIHYDGSNGTLIDPSDKTIKTVRAVQTDAAMNPGTSGGVGVSVNTGKMVFMPTMIIPGEIHHGVGFGAIASELSSDIKGWIKYEQDSTGRFVEPVANVEESSKK